MPGRCEEVIRYVLGALTRRLLSQSTPPRYRSASVVSIDDEHLQEDAQNAVTALQSAVSLEKDRARDAGPARALRTGGCGNEFSVRFQGGLQPTQLKKATDSVFWSPLNHITSSHSNRFERFIPQNMWNKRRLTVG